MDPADLGLRNATYHRFAELGRAPTVDEIAAATGRSADEVRAGWLRLHEGHALVLDAQGRIRMANPFSAVPTPFRVEANGRSWFANCGWDAFGIGAALHVDSEFETACPDCHEAIRVVVQGGRPEPDELFFHVLVPAREWWTDIGYT